MNLEIILTSHHSCFDLWETSLNNLRKYGFEGKINIVSDPFYDLNVDFVDSNFEIHQEKGDWVTRLFKVLCKKSNQDFILITTDDIFIKDNDFVFLLNLSILFLRIKNENVFNLCYTYNRIFLENRKFVKKIDKISPHLISLRPTVYKIDFLINLLDQIKDNKNKSLSAADFEILASLILQRDNIYPYGLSRKYSLKFDELISRGKLKTDISKELFIKFKNKFSTLSFYQQLKYFSYLIVKEILDNFFPRSFLRFLIRKKLFWRLYE